jgi:hypothetical protein
MRKINRKNHVVIDFVVKYRDENGAMVRTRRYHSKAAANDFLKLVEKTCEYAELVEVFGIDRIAVPWA